MPFLMRLNNANNLLRQTFPYVCNPSKANKTAKQPF